MTADARLPEFCLARLPSDGSTIIIKRGISGYWPFSGDVDAFNNAHGITSEMIEAMLIGSMFGWDVPGAQL